MTLGDVASLPEGRLLGVDLGTVRIGLAVCDPDQTIATADGTIALPADARPATIADQVAAAATERSASGVVIGNPRRLDGREGRAAARARTVAELLASVHGLAVALVDERFSTVEAARVMRDQDVDSRAARADVDRVAAAIILQHALERRRA